MCSQVLQSNFYTVSLHLSISSPKAEDILFATLTLFLRGWSGKEWIVWACNTDQVSDWQWHSLCSMPAVLKNCQPQCWQNANAGLLIIGIGMYSVLETVHAGSGSSFFLRKQYPDFIIWQCINPHAFIFFPSYIIFTSGTAINNRCFRNYTMPEEHSRPAEFLAAEKTLLLRTQIKAKA